jgi:membrane-bound lytic murein transglycosylase D
LLLLASRVGAAPPATTPPSAPAPATPAPGGDLYDEGKALFDALAPPEIKVQYDFPTRAELDDFVLRLQSAFDTGSLASLAAYEDNAKLVLAAMRAVPEDQDYADWLQDRIEDMEVARESQLPPPPPPRPPAPPSDFQLSPFNHQPPPAPPPLPARSRVPLYDLWTSRLRNRPPPARAAALLPMAKAARRSRASTRSPAARPARAACTN